MTLETPLPLTTGAFAPFHTHPWLKPAHRLRILSGAWVLEHDWPQFPNEVPEFPADHRTACVRRWSREWEQAVSSPAVLKIPIGLMVARLIHLDIELRLAFT
ncbi:hypothetical protein B0H17DRAFT_1130561 [Mycena rosella]|uniref:Uncharacterized protein n=1 Tax=Mycena rosella TaxID=1033263 RepID=A0AAD7GJ03_MYCRO|nr:hypothetical protein B0H17DRAFT_1130561 [Mycena rosella]